MHLLIPFAGAAGEAARATLARLELPHLARCLAALPSVQRTEGPADSLTPPHEAVLTARPEGPAPDGGAPLAAWLARQDGLDGQPGELPIGLLTPTHWSVGAQQVHLQDPDDLQLDEVESRALFAAMAPLFEEAGWTLHWGAPTRWYGRHASLADLRTASLDRVIGRAIDAWMPADEAARALRRLQSEVQMLWFRHPVNAAREARGQPPVNSFWLSGCGHWPPRDAGPAPQPVTGLRRAALAGDWPAWGEAWCRLDSQVLPGLLQRLREAAPAALTLCGEQAAQRFATPARPAWQRWLAGGPRGGWRRVLESL